MAITEYKRPTFTVTGIEFRLKKPSPANTEKVLEFVQEQAERYQSISTAEDLEEIDEEKYLKDTLRLIAEPIGEETYDEVDYYHADQQKIMHYLQEGFIGAR